MPESGFQFNNRQSEMIDVGAPIRTLTRCGIPQTATSALRVTGAIHATSDSLTVTRLLDLTKDLLGPRGAPSEGGLARCERAELASASSSARPSASYSMTTSLVAASASSLAAAVS